MALRGPRPKVSDGVIIFLTVALMGAPGVLGDHLANSVQQWMFYGGLGALVIFVAWRWGRWFLGFVVNPQPDGVREDLYVGRDNSGTQQNFHGPVNIHHAPSVHIQGGARS